MNHDTGSFKGAKLVKIRKSDVIETFGEEILCAPL